jgi:hypothetical protein
MADINDLITQGLLPQPQQGNAAVPSIDPQGPDLAALQNLPQGPSLAPEMSVEDSLRRIAQGQQGGGSDRLTADNIQTRAHQSYQDMLDQVMAPYLDKNGKPKKSTRVIEILKALTSPAGTYETPIQRSRDIVNKQFPLETGRVNSIDTLGRMQNQMDIAQSKIAQQQRDLEGKNTRAENTLTFKNKEEQDRVQSRKDRQDSLNRNIDSMIALRGKQGAVEDQIARIKALQTDPNITPGQLYDDIMHEPDPEKRAIKLQAWQAVHAASSPFASMGTTSTQSMPQGPLGPTVTQNQRNINPATNPALNLITTGQFSTGTNSAPRGTGAVPAATPQVSQTSVKKPSLAAPSTPVASTTNPNGAVIDALDGRGPLPTGKAANAQLLEEDKKKGENIRKIRSYEMMANNGVENLINAMGNGSAKDFQGWLKGNKMAGDWRSMFGDVSSNEALQKLNGLDLLYGKLGANVRGRFTLPEIEGHLRTMGSLTQSPQNAMTAMAALKLQANLMRMIEHGDIDPDNQQQMNKLNLLVKNELDRLKTSVGGMTNQDRLNATMGKPMSSGLHLNSIEDLLKNQGAPQGRTFSVKRIG